MDEFLVSFPQWLSGGPDRDVVVSSRVRYIRDLAGEIFPWRASREESFAARDRICGALRACIGEDQLRLRFLEDCDSIMISALRERGLLSGGPSDIEGRAVAAAFGGSESFIVNGIDHLRIVAWAAGSDARQAFRRAKSRESLLDRNLSFSASRELGYLTSRPEDVGSALRLSALVFIPGIIAAGVFDRVARGLLSSGVEPRIRGREGDWPHGHEGNPYVELSARATLGVSEEEFVEGFVSVLDGLVEGERRTRERVLQRDRTRIEDGAFRAAAVLHAARRLGAEEFPLLSERFREGLAYGVLRPRSEEPADPYAVIDGLRFLASPAHVRFLARIRGGQPSADPDEVRSELVRKALPRYDI